MSLYDDPPLHDFPDRAIRMLLTQPAHLRELLIEVIPALAPGFDCERAVLVNRQFTLENWQRRESDLLFEIPYRDAETELAMLVCVLLEHQSRADPAMPLRLLIYAVRYWERQWQAWQEGHARGEPLQLRPVLPIVLHTGQRPWRTNRSLAELMSGPEALRAFVPEWPILFWDLAEKTPQALLDSAGEWLQALAVVRAERDDAESFQTVFAEVLRRLEGLGVREPIRWHDLLWFVLSWALRRRPPEEGDSLIAAAEASQVSLALRQEVKTMSNAVKQNWESWMLAKGKVLGEEIGEARGLAKGELKASRRMLARLLEQRFGPLPEALRQQIEQVNDPQRLQDAHDQVLQLASLDDLRL